VTVYATSLVAVIIDDVCFAADANGSGALVHITRFPAKWILSGLPPPPASRQRGAVGQLTDRFAALNTTTSN
jgi:hypothetical protein